MTLHQEQGTHKLFVKTSKIRKEKRRSSLMEEDWVVFCQALFQSIKEVACIERRGKLKKVTWKIGVKKKAGQRGAGLGKLACKTTSKEPVGQPRRNESRPSGAEWNCAKVYETCESSTQIRPCECARIDRLRLSGGPVAKVDDCEVRVSLVVFRRRRHSSSPVSC